MKKLLTIVSAALLLAACGVSPEHQKALADLQAACAAGNPDACTAATYQAQANQQEAAANQAAANNLGAALLAGAAAGAIVATSQPVYVATPVYVHHGYRRW